METNCINLKKTKKNALSFAFQYNADKIFLNFPASNGDEYVFPYLLSGIIKRTSVWGPTDLSERSMKVIGDESHHIKKFIMEMVFNASDLRSQKY